MSFVHLHVHTMFSLLDGLAKPDELAGAAKAMGQKAVAITDHGTMGGVVEHHTACEAAGVKPIIGCEVYLTRDRFVKDKVRRADATHLTLLAKNEEGYRNLLTIASLAELEGFYYVPRADLALVAEHRAGLIVLSGCLKSELAALILNRDGDGAGNQIKRYRDLFGEDYYIEIQPNGLQEQVEYNKGAADLAWAMGVPMVATNDVHYVRLEDAKVQDAMLAVQSGKTLADERRIRFGWDQFYLMSEAQMLEMFKQLHPELLPEWVHGAIDNTGRVAEKCEVDIKALSAGPPMLEIPEGYENDVGYLVALCSEGWKARGGGELSADYRERLQYEIETICDHDFTGYFILVEDLMRHARSKGIAAGPGRGSVAGSLVAYMLGITQVNPMEHGLMFERFINPDRFTPPDIDMDFQDDRRQEVKDYLSEKYGVGNVASIRTNNTLKAKNALKDVCRIEGISPTEANAITKHMDDDSENLTTYFANMPELAALERKYHGLKDLAIGLEGRIRQRGLHAAGVIVSAESLLGLVPLEMMKSPGGGGQVTSAWDKYSLEKMGHLKLDVLGSKTVRVLEHTRQLVKEHQGVDIDWEKVDREDPAVFKEFCDGNTEGVFQFMGYGMTNLSIELEPSCFEDIVSLNALIRPGPARYSKDYVARKHGRAAVPDTHPTFADITEQTFGLMIYQEQAIQLVHQVAGFTLAEADEVRNAIAKKKDKEMAKWEKKFLDGAGEMVGEHEALELWNILKEFSSYLFNKAHSTAYSYVSYYTMWSKLYYPHEFMTALLNSAADDDMVHRYIQEARRLGIKMLPPNVNKSAIGFSIEGDAIRAGLNIIKGVGDRAVTEILKGRGRGFESFPDFVLKVHGSCVKKDVVKALIRDGAFRAMYPRTDVMLQEFEDVIKRVKKSKKHEDQLELNLVGIGHAFEDLVKGWKAS